MYQKISSSWLKHWDFILLDFIFLQAAYVLAYLLRNGTLNPYADELYRNIAVIICMADICAVFFLEGYRGIMRRGYFQELKAVLEHVLTICIFELAYLYLTQGGERFSRGAFIIFVFAAVLLLYAERIVWKSYLLRHKKVFYKQKALLVVTTSDRAEHTLQVIQDHTYNELTIAGVILADKENTAEQKISGIPVVCTVEEIPSYIQTRWIDGIIIDQSSRILLPEKITNICIAMGVSIHRSIAEVGKEGSGNQEMERLGGFMVVTTAMRMATARQLFLKRALDICGAVVGLILTLILSIFVAPAIFISSPGPVIFSQTRVGKNGRRFKIYKFRSMYLDAEKRKKELMEKNEMNGLMFKMDADPRIIGSGPDGTRHGIGWFIRKTSIDELPQFYNILKGEMSLVGTRPPTEDEWEQYEYHHRGRMAIKPGLTGMWQVSGRSNITDFEEVVKLDMDYIQHWNIGLDIKILLKTVLVVLKGQGSK